MVKWIHSSIVLASLSLIVSPAHAQVDPAHVVVQSDRILIGSPDFVPRFLNLPKVLTVKAGQQFEAPADSTWDYIEVAGTLKISRAHDTVLRFTHLFVLPGGMLDAGTAADPIPATRHVEFVIRDVPIDTARDPFQWGNALLNFGHQSRVGASKLAWAPLTGDVAAGATTVTLSVDPQGWQVGDELLLPDTRQPILNLNRPIAEAQPRREAKVTIAAIDGRTITLSKPTDFEHRAQREPDGTVVLQPRLANLTRNIVVRSENPAGTPGHTADIGHEAMWDIRYNELDALGRTRGIKLDKTILTPLHVGTNQPGRYEDHHHHAHGFGSATVGSVLRGHGNAGKWGVVIHGTHDATVEDNVAVDLPGSAFITEDGYETRNAFRRNFAAYSFGNYQGNDETAVINVAQDNPGAEGACFWFRGIQNIIEANEAWDCTTGIMVVQKNQVAADYPSKPGGAPDTPFKMSVAVPVSFSDNVTASNVSVGLEYWHATKFPVRNHVMSYNGRAQFFIGISGPAQSYFINPTVVGDGRGVGLHSGMAYIDTLELDGGGRIVGLDYGLAGGGGQRFVRLSGTPSTPLRMQNAVDINMIVPPLQTAFENILFVPLTGHPLRYIEYGSPDVWSGTGRLPPGVTMRAPMQGSLHTIKNWQGTGKDYRLFERHQLGSTPAWPSDWAQLYGTPEAGLTVWQAWSKYGLAYQGEAVNDADVVPLEGLINGLARPNEKVPLGPPRGVVTFPTPRVPAIVEAGEAPSIRIYVMFTGDPTGTGDALRVSIDGGSPFLVPPRENGDFRSTDARSFVTRNVSEGTHTIRTWRTNANKDPIASSEMTFQYVVGPPAPPAATASR